MVSIFKTVNYVIYPSIIGCGAGGLCIVTTWWLVPSSAVGWLLSYASDWQIKASPSPRQCSKRSVDVCAALA